MKTPRIAAFVIDTVRIEGLPDSHLSPMRDGMIRDAVALLEGHPAVASVELVSANDPAEVLGLRLRVAAVRAFASGADAVLYLGAQTPTLPLEVVSIGVEALSPKMSAVVGQDTSGGLYVLGLNDLFSDVFTEVDHDELWWGGADEVTRAVQFLSGAADHVNVLPEWRSIVDVASLRSLMRERPDLASGAETFSAWTGLEHDPTE
jgi:hypothetical protein